LGLTAWVSRNTRVSKSFMSINPVCPQRGPYEASEGIYHGHGHKTRAGQAWFVWVCVNVIFSKIDNGLKL
jgi:hypothetical protein